jgi:glycosyltransferase involved in cell wall biosynthesis
LTENVVDGVTGLIARRRDAWDLADKVGALLHNPGLRLTMSENAARRAQEAFALPTVTSGFLELYSKL